MKLAIMPVLVIWEAKDLGVWRLNEIETLRVFLE
jgi:hypothetical protein